MTDMEKFDTFSELQGSINLAGLGIDIVANARVARMLARYNRRFLERCFTTGEIEYCMNKKDPVPHLAARLAAKEAAYKAFRAESGMGLGWKEFEVVHTPGSVPGLKLNGNAIKLYKRLGVDHIWLSIAHEDDWSAAVVFLQLNPD